MKSYLIFDDNNNYIGAVNGAPVTQILTEVKGFWDTYNNASIFTVQDSYRVIVENNVGALLLRLEKNYYLQESK